MDSENIECRKTIHKNLKKCEFCGRELEPIELDYLYSNYSSECIGYKHCNCNKAQEYWQERDKKEYEINKRKHFRESINNIYKQNYIERKYQEMILKTFILIQIMSI